ncbi:hypothetical protein ACYOEI_21680 [Singulisphaera rosea]
MRDVVSGLYGLTPGQVEELLAEDLDPPLSLRAKDLFRYLLMTAPPATFEACFNGGILSLRNDAIVETGIEQVCRDEMTGGG